MRKTNEPNVLFIMADQWRYDYLGCAGAEFMHTPNIDALAKAGVRFSNCYTNAPVCAPARIGLASGLQPFRVGALDNHAHLPSTQPTYYQQLRDHGYRVGCCGKLDISKPDKYNGREGRRPHTYGWGFTDPIEIEGKMHAARGPNGPYGYYLQERGEFEKFSKDYHERAAAGFWRGSHDSVLPDESFSDTYIGRRSVEWIENISDEYPWHLFVSFVGPHDPFDPPTEWADRHRETAVPEAIPFNAEGKPRWIRERAARQATPPEETRHARRQYVANCDLIDHWVGRIIEAVEKRGEIDNTYIIFASDHGEMLGDHDLYTKSMHYEASWHVPLIIAGPDITGGRVSDALVELIDLNPTITDLAGVPALSKIDARSVLPVAAGQTDTHRESVLGALGHTRAVFDGRWKYIENTNDVSELYDLETDPTEQHNVIDKQPDQLQRMRNIMRERLVEGGRLR